VRAAPSAVEPAASGTTIVMGLLGNDVSAGASAAKVAALAMMSPIARVEIRPRNATLPGFRHCFVGA
jgi:hypothetical protein